MIYFLVCAGANCVKIGYTRGAAETRAADIATACPLPLDLVAEVPGDARLERAVHAEFDSLRVRGEWFRLEGELRTLVYRLVIRGPEALAEYFAGLRAKYDTFEHGTVSAYIARHCRCGACGEAWSVYQAARRLPVQTGTPTFATPLSKCTVCGWFRGRRGRRPNCITCYATKSAA